MFTVTPTPRHTKLCECMITFHASHLERASKLSFPILLSEHIFGLRLVVWLIISFEVFSSIIVITFSIVLSDRYVEPLYHLWRDRSVQKHNQFVHEDFVLLSWWSPTQPGRTISGLEAYMLASHWVCLNELLDKLNSCVTCLISVFSLKLLSL